MKDLSLKKNYILILLGLLAVGFGLLTIKSGSFALFGGEEGKQFAGKYVSFVLWFNFIAGFFYVVSGVGILLKKEWSVILSKLLAILTSLIFIGFGIVVLSGGDYEMRTVGAMTVRSSFWIVVFLISKQIFSVKKK